MVKSNTLKILVFVNTLVIVYPVQEPEPTRFGNGPNEINNPHWTNANWLSSKLHFTFYSYKNPHATGLGVLRVLNDDLVQPLRG
jgi:quercetin 2,3-dioxygenase